MFSSNFVISPVDLKSRRDLPLAAGMTVQVKQKITEGDKSRLQSFEGLIISCRHGCEPGATFTVRRVVGGIGVEKTFPLYSPLIDKIEILKQGKVRRAKLYFVRTMPRRDIRRQLKQSIFVTASPAIEAGDDEEEIIVSEAKTVA